MIESQQTEQEFEIQKYFYMLLARKWFFVAAAVISFISVQAYFTLKAPVFVAKTDIAVENPMLRKSLSIEEINDRKIEIKTRLAHITSQTLLEEVVRNLNLVERFGEDSEGDLIQAIQKSILAEESGKKTNVITITVRGKSPELVAEIANAVADTYVKQDAEATLYISKKLNEWLALDKRIGSLSDLSPANKQALQAIESIPSVLKDDVLKNLKEQRIAISAQIRELSQYYLPKYPPLAFLNSESIEIDKQVWDRTRAILQSIKIGADEGLIPSTLRILNYAHVPSAPDTSKQTKIVFLAVFFSLFGLFAYFVARDFADRTIKTESDLINIPFLGYIPSNPEAINLRELPYKTKEASSLVRTSIDFSMPTDREKCILMTSPLPSEGKTTVASILATAMARGGKKTILVNGDMRRPKISQLFDVPPDHPGLSNYLAGKKSKEEVIIKTFRGKLDLILAGAPTGDSSDLLSSDRFQNLIKSLRADYDKVIIDAPPLMMGISDPLLISKCVDSVVLVTRFNKTNRLIFNHALNHLRNIGAPVIGVIINGFDSSKMRNSPYKYYNTYYSYNLMRETAE